MNESGVNESLNRRPSGFSPGQNWFAIAWLITTAVLPFIEIIPCKVAACNQPNVHRV